MSNTGLRAVLIALALIGAFIVGGAIVWTKYQKGIVGSPNGFRVLPPGTAPRCSITNCHGLDITCGGKPVQMCTQMYQLGDKCRQFAECGVVNGTCQVIDHPQFTACKTCVEKCQQAYPNNPEQAFACESQCGG